MEAKGLKVCAKWMGEDFKQVFIAPLELHLNIYDFNNVVHFQTFQTEAKP